MTTPIAITSADQRILLDLLRRHLPDTEVWVYGSRVTGAARPPSDLDMVVFASPDQRFQVADLREALEDSALSFRVDLFIWSDVPESFRNNIQARHVAIQKGKPQPAEPQSR